VAHPVDLVVDDRVLVDESVGRRDVRLRLGSRVADEVPTAFSGKLRRISPQSCAASVLFGARISVGLPDCWMTLAMVNVCPNR
jgi:hypothetical protein